MIRLEVDNDDTWRLLMLDSIVHLCEDADQALVVRERSIASLVDHPSLDMAAARTTADAYRVQRQSVLQYVRTNVCINTGASVPLLEAAWTASRIEHDHFHADETHTCAWSGLPADAKITLYGNGTTDHQRRCEHTTYVDQRWCMFTEALRIVGNLDGMLRHIVAETYFNSKQEGHLAFRQELVLTEAHKTQRLCYNMAVGILTSVAREQTSSSSSKSQKRKKEQQQLADEAEEIANAVAAELFGEED